MNNLETLLREWAVMEPDRCYVFDENRMNPYAAHVDGCGHPCDWPGTTQVAVQEAIEARGWKFGIENYSGPKAAVAALKRYKVSGIYNASANTIAEALLSAYLQALKANA